jgi:error-prone DNA polymerase
MPEATGKHRQHPSRRDDLSPVRPGASGTPYAELQVVSNFSFLRGASHPDELVERAAAAGCAAISITDINTLAGVVRAHAAAREIGIPFVVGCRLELGMGEEERRRGEEEKRRRVNGEAALPPEINRNISRAAFPGCTHEKGSLKGCPTLSSEPGSLERPPHRFSAGEEEDGGALSVLVYPTDRASYGRLCRLLTLGKRRAPKGECHLMLEDLIEHQAGLLAVALPSRAADFPEILQRLRDVFDDDRLSLAASCLYGGDDGAQLARLAEFSRSAGVPLVATNDVHYHVPERRPLQDVLVCIRNICTIQEAGHRLFPNGERSIKGPEEMARLFADHPQAVGRTVEIARRAAGFSLDQLRYEYPQEVCPRGRTPMAYLRELTWKGACERFAAAPLVHDHELGESRASRELGASDVSSSESLPSASSPSTRAAIPGDVVRRIEHEFELIEALDYARYFLTVHDIVTFARGRGILCQGRGAAANSAVCYCLGITAVDPTRIDMLFERFVSKERNEPPDIDIDFEHERREEVIQYIYRKYGRQRAALCAEVITYRGRSAIRDVGKAMGLSLDMVDRMARQLDWWDGGVVSSERIAEMGLDPRDPTIRMVLELAHEILGFPRHLSQHVGGFVITEGLLEETVPIENAAMEERTVIEWDKDDIDAMGMLKVDVLGLGMLTAIRKGLEFVNQEYTARGEEYADIAEGCAEVAEEGRSGEGRIGALNVRSGGDAAECVYSSAPLELHTVPPEDPAVYEMICHADTVGVFQIESRAQMSMLPRLRPRCYYDLVIEVAIVRPGPIQGDMIHPYLRRRTGQEPVTYPSPEVERVLGRTLGVPLFQEQAMQLAVVAAGFTPGESDQLRRAIAAWRRKPGLIESFGRKLKEGMIANGYSPQFADQVFTQIQGFSGYGFPESHAASFALLVYVSAWLKRHHPAAFTAALLNSQPMGFYAPAQLVRDAREHGVEVRPVDVNLSGWDCRLEKRTGSSGQVAEWQSGRVDEPARTTPRCHSATLPLSFIPPHLYGAGGPAVRLGMRLVRGLGESHARAIESAVVAHEAFGTIEALWRASGVPVSALVRLARADAFNSMGLTRREALWHIHTLRDESLPLFDAGRSVQGTSASVSLRSARTAERESATTPGSPDSGETVVLPPMPPDRQVVHDYATLGLSLKAHPMSFLRERLNMAGVQTCGILRSQDQWPHGRPIVIAGIVLCRQRPGTASGIVFMTIEDETGVANLIVRPKVWDAHRTAARHSVCILVRGHVERQGEVVHVVVGTIEPLNPRESSDPELPAMSRDFH